MTERSCFELGMCQSRKPACKGCDWKFAPGILEGPFKRRRHQLAFTRTSHFSKVVLVVAGVAVTLACVSLVAGFTAGYINTTGWFK